MQDKAVTRSQYFLLLAQVVRLLLFLLVTRTLGTELAPADFGFFALVSSMFALSLEIIDMGSTAVATRQVAQTPSSERAVLSALLAWRRLMALGLALVCLLLANTGFVQESSQRFVLIAAAVGLFLLHLSAYHVVFQVRQAFGKPLLLGLGAQIGFLLASLLAIRLQAVGSTIALLVVLREIVQVIGSRAIAIRTLGYRLQARLLSPGVGLLLRDAWMFGLCALLYKLSFHACTFFVWMLASPEMLGAFSASLRLFSPVIDTTWAFVTPLIASMSLAARIDPAAFQRQLQAHLSMLLGAGALLAACGILLAAPVLELLYGDRYLHGELSSLATFRWLSAGFACALMTPVLVVGFLAKRRERELLVLSAGGLCVNIMISLWAIPLHGAEGAAMASCATELFIVLGLAGRLAMAGDLSLRWRHAAYLAPAVLLALMLYVLAGQPRIGLVLAMLLGPIALIALWQMPEQKACRRGPATAPIQSRETS